jgi:hypothetical protein
MTTRRASGALTRCCLAVTIAAACLDTTSPTDPSFATGLWVFHVAGGRFARHVQLFRVTEVDDGAWPLRLEVLPTRDWTGHELVDLNLQAARGRPIGSGSVAWTMRSSTGEAAYLTYDVSDDTAYGKFESTREADSAIWVRAVGVRIQPPTWLDPSVVGSSVMSPDSAPVVLLRIDDNAPSDSAFLARLRARSLYGELAIPTQTVGVAGRPNWAALRALVDDGFSVAAHSRSHDNLSGSSSDARFLGEVLGSLEDLAAAGLPTPVFVQPGTWRDSCYFRSSQQYRGWRGAVLRTFARDMEAYVYPTPVALPIADSMRLGLSHFTISTAPSKAEALTWWSAALGPRRFTVFLAHSIQVQPPDTLDWFLDSVATAVRTGRIRLARSSAQLFPP